MTFHPFSNGNIFALEAARQDREDAMERASRARVRALANRVQAHVDAKRAKPAMLDGIFNPIPADKHANDTAAALRQRFQGD